MHAFEQSPSCANRESRLNRLYRSPAWLIVVVAISVFLAEAVVMTLLAHLPAFSTAATIVLDATILLILLLPVFIYFVFRPLVVQIGEHQRAESELQFERNKLRGILDAMDDGVYIVNQQNGIQYLNRALEREFGPVGGRKCFEYFHNRREPCPFCKMQEVFTGKSVRWEWHSSVTGKTYDLFDTPIRNTDGTMSKLEIFHDITDLKEGREALRQERQRLFSLLDELPALVFLQASDYKLRFANRMFLERFGETGDRPCYEIFHGRQVPCEECQTFRVFETKEPIEWEWADAAGRIYEIHAYPFTDVDGTPLVLELGIDVSGRKHAEDALELERNRLRGILDAMEDGIFIVNSDFVIEYANSRIVEQFGPINGRKCYEYFLGTEELCPWCRQSGHPASHPVKTEWHSLNTGNYFEVTAFPIRGDEGGQAVLEILHNVTAQRQAHEQVRKLSRAVEQSPSAIVIVDREGRIEYVNPTFTRLTGYSTEELHGRNPSILKTGHTTPEEYRELWEVISSGQVWQGEFLNRRKNGDQYWEEASISPITRSDGTITHFVGIKQDISLRKRTEDELRASRHELRALSAHLVQVREQERTRIARELHDELGQSLATLKLGVCLLADELDPDQAPLAERTGDMSRLIDETIGTVQRICAELRPAILDDLGLAEALEWQTREFVRRTGIVCVLAAHLHTQDLDSEVATAVYRIYQETLTNVMRHSGATKVEASLTEKGGRLVLTVSDNGSGIAGGEHAERSSFGFIGMRERAAYLGGKIRISSRPGTGTSILVRIPTAGGGVEP